MGRDSNMKERSGASDDGSTLVYTNDVCSSAQGRQHLSICPELDSGSPPIMSKSQVRHRADSRPWGAWAGSAAELCAYACAGHRSNDTSCADDVRRLAAQRGSSVFRAAASWAGPPHCRTLYRSSEPCRLTGKVQTTTPATIWLPCTRLYLPYGQSTSSFKSLPATTKRHHHDLLIDCLSALGCVAQSKCLTKAVSPNDGASLQTERQATRHHDPSLNPLQHQTNTLSPIRP